MEIMYYFKKGGPIMWPLLFTSITALTVVVERIFFLFSEKTRRKRKTVAEILAHVKEGDIQTAINSGKQSKDCVAKVLIAGLRHRQRLSDALLRQASLELKPYGRGLTVLDTAITVAPLLGLLGTVTGMIHAFGLLGNQELSAPTAITGGIAEALIATGFGLAIAITALLPFNFLNAKYEETKHEIEDAATHLEVLLGKNESHENIGYAQ